MERLAISQRLWGILGDIDNKSQIHMVQDVYSSERSYCANSDLLFFEEHCPEIRNISSEEFKWQMESIIASVSGDNGKNT